MCRIVNTCVIWIDLYRNCKHTLLTSCTCHAVFIITPCPQCTIFLKGNCEVFTKLNLCIRYIFSYDNTAEYSLLSNCISCNYSCFTFCNACYVCSLRLLTVNSNLCNRVIQYLPFKCTYTWSKICINWEHICACNRNCCFTVNCQRCCRRHNRHLGITCNHRNNRSFLTLIAKLESIVITPCIYNTVTRDWRNVFTVYDWWNLNDCIKSITWCIILINKSCLILISILSLISKYTCFNSTVYICTPHINVTAICNSTTEVVTGEYAVYATHRLSYISC